MTNINIKEFRARHKLSQEECAVILSCSVRSLSNWENGEKVPDVTIKVMRAFDAMTDIFGKI